ncbi:MAG: hypothetical protein Q9164_005940 [Protoblastenia rupestris]
MSTESLLEKPSWRKPDFLCYSQPITAANEDSQGYLVLFISGNPGLISFYEPFLSRLSSLLSSSNSGNARFHVCGHSFRGFELSPSTKQHEGPFGLEDQIEHQEQLLTHHVKEYRDATGRIPKVILMGHSVGAYVLLELIRRHVAAVSKKDVEDFDLIGGILLFPTIAEIAQSPLGRVFKNILPIPGFVQFVGAIVRGLTYLMPMEALKSLVKLVTRFPEYAAKTATAFIKSPMGPRQALHLARDEMKIITEADWNNEVWGAATSPGTNQRDTINWNLMVYWGKEDQWVADTTRDKLIEARGFRGETGGGLEEGKSRMEIDKDGIPHDFCTTIRMSNARLYKMVTEANVQSFNRKQSQDSY